jgi:hypothetical protein
MVGPVFVASVFFSQHDRQHTIDDGLSIWILDIRFLIQIDLEKDRMAIGLASVKRAARGLSCSSTPNTTIAAASAVSEPGALILVLLI